MPGRIKSAPTDIREAVGHIFEQAQLSTANHRKNFVTLGKLHLEAATEGSTHTDGGSPKIGPEDAFELILLDMVMRVLALKKGVPVAERTIKFLGGYLKFISRESQDEPMEDESENDKDLTEKDLGARFIPRLLEIMLMGFEAKDKTARYRVLQLVTEFIPQIPGTCELLPSLLDALLERIWDKEVSVRTQAAIALATIMQQNIPTEDLDVLDVLLEMVKFDEAPDVRRTVLQHLPVDKRTISGIIERTRDFDIGVRKLVYIKLTEELQHPKSLTIEQRETLVRNGLEDREPPVREGATKLIGSWIEADDLIQFLGLFDLMSGEIAEKALLSAFETKPALLGTLDFADQYWQELTLEKALLVRVFMDHCLKKKDFSRLESSMPVVTALAFQIQGSYNSLLRRIQKIQEDSTFVVQDDKMEETNELDLASRIFILNEMLTMSVNLDYADEIGRRKMFSLIKDMISHDVLPEKLLAGCLDVLRTLSASERDLILVIVEVIHELRDPPEEDGSGGSGAELDVEETPMPNRTPRPQKPVVEMSEEEKRHADAIDSRCLTICTGMLERVNSTFEENSTLEGILKELILPAVNNTDVQLREKGVVCLGLCCLITRRMALSSFQLFLNRVQASPESLKIRLLHILFDIMMVHEIPFNTEQGAQQVAEFLRLLLEKERAHKVQATLCIGFAKLMLAGLVTDEEALKSLVIAYVSPRTNGNQELRQCLSYFLPVYCYSSSANQTRMQKLFISLFELFIEERDLDGSDEMIDASHFGSLLVDWTDPQRSMAAKGDQSVHVELAIDILKELMNKKFTRENRKVLAQLLGKLYLPLEVDDVKIRTVKLLLHTITNRRPLRDASAKAALARFDTVISKRYEAQLAGLSEEEYRKLEYLDELFQFLDEISEDEEEETPAPRRRAKRRSDSISTTTTASALDGTESIISTSTTKGKSKKAQRKKRRVSTSDDSDSDASVSTRRETPPPPRRALPGRAVKGKTKVQMTQSLSDSEDDEYESVQVADDSSMDTDFGAMRIGDKAASRKQRNSTEDLPSRQDSDSDSTAEVDDLLDD